MAKTLAQEVVDKAHEIQERYAGILLERAANRRTLRDLGTQGLLTDEEMDLVDEIYPERKSKEDNDEPSGE